MLRRTTSAGHVFIWLVHLDLAVVGYFSAVGFLHRLETRDVVQGSRELSKLFPPKPTVILP